MGQAKKKGTLEKRMKTSLLSLRKELPNTINCQQCSHLIKEIVPSLELKKRFDIQHLGLAHCDECKHISVCIGDSDMKKLNLLSEFIYKSNTTEMFGAIYESEKEVFEKVTGQKALKCD